MKAAVSVDNIAKEYILGSEAVLGQNFREMLMGAVTSPFKKFKRLSGRDSQQERFWALRNISFEVQPGEVVGIIGRNGAGKSTLLRVLSRITTPTEGEIIYNGRMASLLEVGTGFHPELTGRENIYLNGAILGMTRQQISHRMDDIVEFAEISKFLDTPVKRFSSGMYVRLAFSVAAHLDPDILIVDEVLAVGDALFQQKCLGKLKDTSTDGRTVFFVSHNMAAVKNLCTRIIYIKDGQIEFDGAPDIAIGKYLSSGKSATAHWQDDGNVHQYLKKVSIENSGGLNTDRIQYNESALVKIQIENIDQSGLTIASRFTDVFGNIVFTSWDKDSLGQLEHISKTPKNLVCELPSMLFKPGKYTLTVFVRYLNHRSVTSIEEVNLDINVSGEHCVINDTRSGVVAPVLKWSLT